MSQQELTPLFGDAGGYDREGFSADGRDREGYDREGFSADGRDREGYDREGLDARGYNREGWNEDGYGRDGEPLHVDSGELDLRDLWITFCRTWPVWTTSSSARQDFREHLREITTDPDSIIEVEFCYLCGYPAWDEDTLAARGNDDTPICENCRENWSDCDDCDSLYPDSEMSLTVSDGDICEGCRDADYTYCSYCGAWRRDEDAEQHSHGSRDDSCCESPLLEFAIRNDGEEPLQNDTRTTVALPSGTISAVGLRAIGNYLYRASVSYEVLAYDLAGLGDQWQTREGNYAKRLSSHAYKTHHIKLPPDVMSQVGCLAREHSNPVDVIIDVTRDLNQSAGDFYHEDSCWWGSYSESRCTLKTNGGFGLRSFNDNGTVSGRAWVLPLRRRGGLKLRPTFDTLTPDAFAVFNGYGALDGYIASRVLAHLAGWTYRKISFSCRPMWVNAGGYLVANEDTARNCSSLDLDLSQHSRLFGTEQAAEKAARNAQEEPADVRS